MTSAILISDDLVVVRKGSVQWVPNTSLLPKSYFNVEPTLISFENHWAMGNLKYWVLPDIFHIPRHKIMNHYLHSCPTQTQPLPKCFCSNTT